MISLYSCIATAQTVLPLTEDNWGNLGVADNYYKDIDNDMDYFVGTWIHDKGTTSLKIILKKEERVAFGGSFKDMLVGEYVYYENGKEIVNSINMIDQRSGMEHLIHGNTIRFNCTFPKVDNCKSGAPRFRLHFKDPDYGDPLGTLDLYLPRNKLLGPDRLMGSLRFKYYSALKVGETFPEINLPWQAEFVFIRQ
jgi:hypothetical protein